MSGYYPDGCTQADHDRAFGELGPSPEELAAEADAENDFDADYPDDDAPMHSPHDAHAVDSDFGPTEEMISKRDARTICRVFMALERQVRDAVREGDWQNQAALCRLIGGLFYNALGPITAELGE